MKPFSLRGLAVLTALLLVPLLSVPATAQDTWYFENTGMEVSKVWDIPCAAYNAQAGATLTDSLAVMCLRFANTSNPAAADTLDIFRLTSTFTESMMVDSVWLFLESGGGTPTGPGDF